MKYAPHIASRITIAIPTYNRCGLLKRALDSALAQTSDRVDILVSDNGSTDGTAALLEDYRDSRLRVIRRETTVSRAQHGTLIFAVVETKFVLVLSDDDFIAPEFSSAVLHLFDEHPELSFVYTGCLEHYDEQAFPALVGPRIESSLEFIAGHFAGLRQVSWCACVTRIEALRRHGPQPEDRICGDMYFWSRIAFEGPVGCVSLPLAHYTALLPGGDNESRTTPIISWAMDLSRVASEVRISVRQTDAPLQFQRALEADIGRYLTRSIANQFVWARINGMNRVSCLRTLPAISKFRGWHALAIVRVIVCLALPRQAMRSLVVRGARRLAARRH